MTTHIENWRSVRESSRTEIDGYTVVISGYAGTRNPGVDVHLDGRWLGDTLLDGTPQAMAGIDPALERTVTEIAGRAIRAAIAA